MGYSLDLIWKSKRAHIRQNFITGTYIFLSGCNTKLEDIGNCIHPVNPLTPDTVEPVCNDHLYDEFYCLWFIQ